MNKVLVRSNLTSGSIPQPSELEPGELLLGAGDGRLWTKTADGNVMLLNPMGTVTIVSASYALAADVAVTSTSASYALTSSAATSITFTPATSSYTPSKRYLNFVISSDSMTTGFKGHVQVPETYILKSASLFTSGSGSIHFDIRKSTYDAWSPVVESGTSITGSTRLSMSNNAKYKDTSSLQGWTTSFVEDDILSFFIKEISGSFTKAIVTLKVIK